ncbi:MAG: amino acid adenylation domain-containing protein, partial [Gammaproteobacteria bacterium]|nr:amino acid adenylation domain-containing protein [Gammaproteobacteria bacterium]
CTLFMVLLAAFDVLMARYTGSEDTVVGTPIAGRQRTEVEGLVGLFVNTLVMRVDVGGNPTFAELLARVRAISIDAFSNQELPFEKLVEILQPARDMSHTPLFQTMFALQNTPWEAQPIRGVTVSPGETSPGETAKFDLSWSANEFDGELWLSVEYNSDLFDATTIEQLVAVYESMLVAIVENPSIETASLGVALPHSDLRRLADWNDTAMAYDRGVTVVERVLEQARRTPDAIAIEDDGERMTHAELASRIEGMADNLRNVLPSNETQVAAILVDRSPAMVVAVFGAMHAGAAYLPLDPQYPAERIEYMLDDSGSAILITDDAERGALRSFGGTLVVVDEAGAVTSVRRGDPIDVCGVAAGTAYVIYTSGSTGLPKGVCISHAALANFIVSMTRTPGISPGDRLLAVTTLSFDIAALELMLPLTAGATVIIASTETAADGRALATMIDACEPSVMQATPSTWRMLLNAGWQGRQGMTILCGGEPLDRALARQLLSPRNELWNMYGPTETTIWSTCMRIADGDTPITVGRPIGNTRIHILDGQMRLAPIGVAGELCIGGEGLADGYHRRPELTAERFVVDPVANDGGRLYRTGDRARWRRDGTLELLGRMDRQVKLRGFRIELGEIEAALTSVSGIEAAVVVLDEVSPGDTRIVAYVVPEAPKEGVDTARLRDELRRGLPDYMVPSLTVAMPSVPLTPNGKVDRRALPWPDWSSLGADGFVAPRDAIETAVADLFAEVLGRPAIGVHDSFFELGGHSLLATQLVARIRDAFAAELPLRALFDAPTVAGLAEFLRSDDAEALARALARPHHQLRPRAADRRHDVPASFVQQRMWFLDRLEPGNPVYNLVRSMRVSGELEVAPLEQAVAALVMRHETLRTTIVGVDGEAMQRIEDECRVPVVIESIDSGAAIDTRLAAIARRPFDLATGPLVRVHVLQSGEREHVLVLIIHHIVADGWSMAVLFDELAHAYNAYRAGRAPEWPPLPVQYADYALWQRGWLAGAELERQLGYWRQQLGGASPQLPLPTDRPRLPVQRHRGAWHRAYLSESLSRQLRELAGRQQTTLFMVLLAAFDAVLARYSGQADVSVGTPIAGRRRTELEGLIGFFVNTLVLRADLRGDPRFDELLARVKHTALDAYAHQDVPFEKIVDELKPARDAGRTPVFQVMFNLHNEPAGALRLEGADVSAFGVARNTSKFDLSVSLSESNDGLYAQFEYDTDLFDAATVAGLGDYYAQVLAAVV